MTDPAPLIACTVAATIDLPAATVARTSFLAQHPDARFVTLVTDGTHPDLLTPADIGVRPDELARLATGHTAREAATVLRPRLLEWLLGTAPDGTAVLYVHPWARFHAPVDSVIDAATGDSSLALVPRVLRPLPEDGLRPTPAELVATGVYDDGFLAVGHGAEQFLHAWADLAWRDPDRATAFLDSAPALVEHRVIRDPGIGLSTWNAAQRPLTIAPGRELMAAGAVLRAMSFAGFDQDRPWLLSGDVADRPRVLLSEHPLLGRLCADHVVALTEAGPAPTGTSLFGQLPDGTELPPGLRAGYRGAAPRPPAVSVDLSGFLRWASEPEAGGTRWSVALWQDDPALRERFPDPFGADADAYRDWCATDAVLAGRLHPRAVPGHASAPEVALVDQIGVSVLGDGPLADRVRAAAAASGLPVSDDPTYPVVLCCGDITGVPSGRRVIAVRSTVGPVASVAAERWLVWPARVPGPPDRVITASITLPLPDPGARDAVARAEARQALGIGDEPVFLAEATLPDVLVNSFSEAFPGNREARLLLVVPDDAERGELAERLRLRSAIDPRVRLIQAGRDSGLAADAADWAVSLAGPVEAATTRVAGWLTEIALRGLPVITAPDAIAADLLGPDCAVILPLDDFSVQAMVAGALRELAEDRATADKLGAAARTRLLEALAVDSAGAGLRRRVELAYRTWRADRMPVDHVDDDPLRALRAARHALLRRPDPDAGHKIPMAPTLRKAVLRVLNHYDAHLTTVLSSLLDGVERTAAEVVRRQDRLSVTGPGLDLDILRADLDLLAERDTQLGQQQAATGEELRRLRGELTGTTKSVHELTSEVRDRPQPVADPQAADRLTRLEAALTAATERIASLESAQSSGGRSATQALQATDALRRVIIRQHESAAGVAEVPGSLVLCDAGLIRLPADDVVMSAVLGTNGVWEPDIAELVDSLIEPDTVFLDVGAYVGYHAVRVLSRLGRSGTVVAVEPSAEAVKLLRHNVSANVGASVAERLIVIESAAWDAKALLRAVPAAGGGLDVGPESVTTATQNDLPIDGVRLDRELDTIAATAKQRVSVVKVDIPGRGHRALGGLVRRLRKDRPNVICAVDGPLTSGFGDSIDVVLREFSTWGYELVRLGDKRPSSVAELVDGVGSGEVRTLWLRPAQNPVNGR